MRQARSTVVRLGWFLLVSCGGMRGPILDGSRAGDRLTLRRVVLFQNGLAYFERRGLAEGRSVDLKVRADQVDDVLKSLTVVDRAGSAVSSVRVLVGRAAGPTTLRVGLSRDGAHDLWITYVAEVTGWKPTYRIVATREGRTRIQGLAVVDNRSGESWQDVALGLSTEVPMSFRYQLRAPRVARRATFGPDGRLVQVEPLGGAGAGQPDASEGAGTEVNRAYALAQGGLPQLSTRAGERIDDPTQDREPAVGVAPATRDPVLELETRANGAGYLVETPGPVTLGQGESGLVPFVDREVPGETVLLYRPAPGGTVSLEHPYRAVLFQNPLDAPLLGGPLAVYGGGRFLGDGVTGTVPGRAHAFVAFALEPSVRITAGTERIEDEIRAVGVTGGMLEVEMKAALRTRFEIAAARPWSQKVFLFVERVEGFEPADLPGGTVAAPSGWFVPAPGRVAQASVDVVLHQRHRTQVNVAADPRHAYVPALLRWLEEGGEHEELPRLREILDRLARIADETRTWEEDIQAERRALTERRAALDALRNVPANGALRARIGAAVAAGLAALDARTRDLSARRAEVAELRQEWWARLRQLRRDASQP